MKKLLLFVSLLLALTLLVACGNKKDDTPTTPTETPNSTEKNPTTPEVPEVGDPIIDFGFYNISNAAGKLLGAPESKNKPVTFDAAPVNISVEEVNTWTIEPKVSAKGELVYVLFCTYDPRDVAQPDKLLPGKELIRVAYDENNATQQWIITENEDGTFKLVNYKNPKFCLVTTSNGQPAIAETEKAGTEANWTIEEKTTFEEFMTWYSKNRKIIFQLPKNTISDAGITNDRIQQFVEDTVTIYETYIDLTGFVTYDHIILKAYETEEHIAYVMNGYMCVSSDKDFIVADLARMAKRTTEHNVHDCNFMMLHEMGHMFDRNQKWTFEGEAMTDIKAAYVLYANPDFVAAPSEFPPAQYFDASNITQAYKSLGGSDMNDGNYSIYCCAAIFVDIIQNNIKDWNKVKEMYHWYHENYDSIDPVAWYIEAHNLEDDAKVVQQVARLDMYIAKLSEFGGVDVRSLINVKDYQTMLEKCSGK